MAILPVNMTNPRRLAQIAQIFAEGQLRNQELQMNLLKQQKEAQDIQNVAKLYQEETARAKDPQDIMNAFGKTAFALMKVGQKAQPILNWLEKDATLRMEAMKQPKVTTKTFRLGPTKPEGGLIKELVTEVNTQTNEEIPGTRRWVALQIAPGESAMATKKAEREDELTYATNTINEYENDKDFMNDWKTFESGGKLKLLQEGKIDEAISGIPLIRQQQFMEYLEAKKILRKYKHGKTPGSKPKVIDTLTIRQDSSKTNTRPPIQSFIFPK